MRELLKDNLEGPMWFGLIALFIVGGFATVIAYKWADAYEMSQACFVIGEGDNND